MSSGVGFGRVYVDKCGFQLFWVQFSAVPEFLTRSRLKVDASN